MTVVSRSEGPAAAEPERTPRPLLTVVVPVYDEEGNVAGHYFSDKDGESYKVAGKVLMPKHTIQFAVKFPRTEQVFRGWMFTGTGLAITGWSKLQDREAGFYATRLED